MSFPALVPYISTHPLQPPGSWPNNVPLSGMPQTLLRSVGGRIAPGPPANPSNGFLVSTNGVFSFTGSSTGNVTLPVKGRYGGGFQLLQGDASGPVFTLTTGSGETHFTTVAAAGAVTMVMPGGNPPGLPYTVPLPLTLANGGNPLAASNCGQANATTAAVWLMGPNNPPTLISNPTVGGNGYQPSVTPAGVVSFVPSP
jgi:hypothetical protein